MTHPARIAAMAAVLAALALAGCSAFVPPEMAKPILPHQEQAYPNFGAPAQVGDRPVMTPAQTAKMQTDLQGLARQQQQVETESEQPQ